MDRMTLGKRFRGRLSKSAHPAASKTLLEKQKQLICNYIERLDHADQSAQLSMVGAAAAANYLFKQNHSSIFPSPSFTVGDI